MNSVLLHSISAARHALFRYGWFPIAVFLLHEFCSHVLDAYDRWPAVDVPLHFLGGLSIAYFLAGSLGTFANRALVRMPDHILRWFLVLSLACTTAVFWEFAEWTSDRLFGTNCQMNDLGDTLFDLAMGLLGALFLLLPQLPSALRSYFTPSRI